MKPESNLHIWLGSLSLKEKIRALALLSGDLTIFAREYRLPLPDRCHTSSVIRTLLGLNELHHKIAFQIAGYCRDETKVYPLDVFAEILFEIAAQYGVTEFLAKAILQVKEREWPVRPINC